MTNGSRSIRTRMVPGSTRSFRSTMTSVTTPLIRGLTLVVWPETKASSVEVVVRSQRSPGRPRSRSPR